MIMDHTLIQQPSPFDFPESKYLGQERYSNSTFATNDFPFPARRAQSTITSTPGVALPANTSVDFNVHSLVGSDTPYHHSPQLLSPPDSITGTTSSSGHPNGSANTFNTLPRPYPSNGCPTEHFSNAVPSILSSNWPGTPMTMIDRGSRIPTLSPPHSYNSASSIGAPYRGTMMGDRLPAYTQGHQISAGSFPTALRYPPSSYPPRTNGQFPFAITDQPYPGASMPQDHQNCGTGEGPPFHDTTVHHHVLTVRGQRLAPELMANIQKGFFQVDRKWTCYRRNYFAVQCSFTLRHSMVDGPYYFSRNGSEELIQGFAVSISAKTATTSNGESETRGLVQHTPKRDKATESTPGRHAIMPALNHAVSASGAYASSGHMFGGAPHPHHVHSTMMGGFGHFDGPSPSSVPTAHTFERIQFQKATANNGKRRAQQQYFLVVVELLANIGRQGTDDWVLIATKESDPMVVRGRSPGHYKDNARRDSQASDGDFGSGHGSGSYSGSMSSMNNYAHGAHSAGHGSMDWSYSRQHGHYGSSGNRHAAANPCYSPMSMGSASTLADNAADAELGLSDSQTAKSSCTLSSDSSALTPLSEGSEDIMFSSLERGSTSRKRNLDEDAEGEHLRFQLPGPFTDNMPSLNDYSAMPYSKLLCASS